MGLLKKLAVTRNRDARNTRVFTRLRLTGSHGFPFPLIHHRMPRNSINKIKREKKYPPKF